MAGSSWKQMKLAKVRKSERINRHFGSNERNYFSMYHRKTHTREFIVRVQHGSHDAELVRN